MKKVITAIITVMYLASFGALAAGSHKCPKGEKWNKDQQKCMVKEKTNNKNNEQKNNSKNNSDNEHKNAK